MTKKQKPPRTILPDTAPDWMVTVRKKLEADRQKPTPTSTRHERAEQARRQRSK